MVDKWIFGIEELSREHTDLVGKKSANLGEIARLGFPAPPGFALSTEAYRRFLSETEAIVEIRRYLAELGEGPCTVARLEQASNVLRSFMETKKMPWDMEDTIASHYEQLCKKCNLSEIAVSVRSAGTVSRPGQYETYLGVTGRHALMEKIAKVWSSSFNLRSLSSQLREGKLQELNPIGVCILKMVNARASGVTFTADPNTGDTSKIICEANWGLGESIVSGDIVPDTYVLDKQTLIIRKKRLGQKTRLVKLGSAGVVEEDVLPEKQSTFCLSDKEVKEIGKIGRELEAHFWGMPQDLEWAIDADLTFPQNIFLLQTRPAIIAKKKNATDEILDLMLNRLYRS